MVRASAIRATVFSRGNQCRQRLSTATSASQHGVAADTMPLLLVSPLAKRNYVDHTLTDQSSVLRFIEDNWLSGERIQPGGSFDTIAGPLDNVFNFDDRDDEGARKLVLDEATGVVVSASKGDNGDRHYSATVLRRGGLQLAATPPTVCSKCRVLPEAALRLSGMTC